MTEEARAHLGIRQSVVLFVGAERPARCAVARACDTVAGESDAAAIETASREERRNGVRARHEMPVAGGDGSRARTAGIHEVRVASEGVLRVVANEVRLVDGDEGPVTVRPRCAVMAAVGYISEVKRRQRSATEKRRPMG